MAGSGNALTRWLRELRRRRVFRTAGLYVAGARLVMQVADLFFPAWWRDRSASFGFQLTLAPEIRILDAEFVRVECIAADSCLALTLVIGERF